MLSMCMMGAYSPWPLGSRAAETVCAPVRRECRLSWPGTLFQGESARCPVSEHDLQLTEDHIPVLAPGVPMFYNSLGCQVQHPTQRIVIGKRRLVLRDLTELTVQALDDVRRVYDFPNFRRIFKEGA